MPKDNGLHPNEWDRCRGCGKPMDVNLETHLREDCGLKPDSDGQSDFSDFVG